MSDPIGSLVQRVLQGDPTAAARTITQLENNTPAGRAALEALYPAGGHAHVVGITGAPGSGKSTLVASLTGLLRRRDLTVAVVAVDPSSSLSGGAILGDRIRMQEYTLDPGTFVRSMSTRGALGGLSRATIDAVSVLDAAGFDYIIIETVGVGQAEVDIVRAAHTIAVVSVPGLGDDIQTIKAGLLEVADLHVVNKADRPDAGKTIAELRAMLTLSVGQDDGWRVPLIGTSSVDGTGLEELADALRGHREWLRESGQLTQRERAAAAARVRAIALELVAARLDDPAGGGGFESLVNDVANRRLDPCTAAEQLIGGAP